MVDMKVLQEAAEANGMQMEAVDGAWLAATVRANDHWYLVFADPKDADRFDAILGKQPTNKSMPLVADLGGGRMYVALLTLVPRVEVPLQRVAAIIGELGYPEPDVAAIGAEPRSFMQSFIVGGTTVTDPLATRLFFEVMAIAAAEASRG